MNLEFEITNNHLKRTDNNTIYNKNRNIYTCQFQFQTGTEEDIWTDLNRFCIFTDSWGNDEIIALGKSDTVSCPIPNSILEGTYFSIALYGGDLVSTDRVTIPLVESGYKHHKCSDKAKDIFVDIFDSLDTKIDDVSFDNDTLYLYSNGELVNSVSFVDGYDYISEMIDEIRSLVDLKADINHTHVSSDVTDLDDTVSLDINNFLDILADELRN